MHLKIVPRQVQKGILAPSMQQSIEVLMIPLAELTRAIDQQIQDNPMLEIDEEAPKPEKESLDDIINQTIKNSENNNAPIYDTNHDDEELTESPITRPVPLDEHLLQQLRLEISDPVELKIGHYIISDLNEDGYMQSNYREIALATECDDLSRIDQVRAIIQTFDPVGVGSYNLSECLLAQVRARNDDDTETLQALIQNHLKDLGGKKLNLIARKLKISIEDVKTLAQKIAKLEPRPAREYQTARTNIYVKPDIIIQTDENNQHSININRDDVPPLRISAFYQRLLKDPDRKQEEKEFIREKIKNALFFIKSIEQRHQTIKDITEYIVNNQKDFLEHGPSQLRPMNLKDVALAIDRNESTVCRAINNKYMDTPQGLYAMKYFFTQGVKEGSLKNVSTRSIKEELKDLIENEDKSRPLSDQNIQNHFETKGLKMARRTISKYRQLLNILPSHLRKE